MNQLEKFWESVKKTEAVFLATSAKESVTMRTVSPVYYKDAILIFTDPASQKYQQLKENPYCCIAAGDALWKQSPNFADRQ
jgi:Pyridoxamine 5''-phosphate oxidase.